MTVRGLVGIAHRVAPTRARRVSLPGGCGSAGWLECPSARAIPTPSPDVLANVRDEPRSVPQPQLSVELTMSGRDRHHGCQQDVESDQDAEPKNEIHPHAAEITPREAAENPSRAPQRSGRPPTPLPRGGLANVAQEPCPQLLAELVVDPRSRRDDE